MSDLKMSVVERAQFLADVHVAIIAIERKGTSPLAVPIWYHIDDAGDVVIWTERGSLKERYIRESGQYTLVVHRAEPPYTYVSVGGPAIIRENVGPDDVRPIVERYVPSGKIDAYLLGAFNDNAILITMRPKHWSTADYGKDSGSS